MENKKIVDVHSHFLAEAYLQEVKNHGSVDEEGRTTIDGYPLPEWTIEGHLKTMDANGIAKCILSGPEINFVAKEKLPALARSINETANQLKTKYPNRFGVFTTLPLPDIGATLKEIDFGLNVFDFEGVCLHSNYNGIYLGEERFAPVFDELNRRKAVVFIHPVSPALSEGVKLGVPGAMLEFPFDSTRTVVSLLKAGTLERCPDIKIIISHGGGTLPFLAPRIAALLGMKSKQNPQEVAQKVIAQIKSLYFDLTAVTHKGALSAIKALMPVDHLLFGFDYPLMPPVTIPEAIKNFYAFDGFDNNDHKAIETGNWNRIINNNG